MRGLLFAAAGVIAGVVLVVAIWRLDTNGTSGTNGTSSNGWSWTDRGKKQHSKFDDEVTIVVKADDRQIIAEKAALAEQQKSLAEEKARLSKIALPAECSVSNGVISQLETMIKHQNAIIQVQDVQLRRLEAGQGSKNGSAGSLAQESAKIAKEREEVNEARRLLAEGLKSFSERLGTVSTCLSEKADTLSAREAGLKRRESEPALAKADAEKAYRRVLSIINEKGIVTSDMPASLQKSLADGANYQRDPSKAMVASESLESWLRDIKVDRTFIDGKIKRVEAMKRKTQDSNVREEVDRLFQKTSQAYSVGNHDEANRVLNNIIHIIEKRT